MSFRYILNPITGEQIRVEAAPPSPPNNVESPPGAWTPVTAKEFAALTAQVGGDHYKKLKIQPVEYIHANQIPFIEGCIIKYATRWRDKGGVKDLEKIKHFVDLLIGLEAKS